MPTFTYAPSYGAAATRKPRVKAIRFGDGYEQRQTDGINRRPEIWDLQFINRSTTDAAAIDAFLATQGGADYFLWTPPVSGAVEGKYICREWSRNVGAGNVESITARFEQVFDL